MEFSLFCSLLVSIAVTVFLAGSSLFWLSNISSLHGYCLLSLFIGGFNIVDLVLISREFLF